MGALDTLEAVPTAKANSSNAVQIEGVGAVVPTHTYVSSSGVRMVVGRDAQGRMVVGNVEEGPEPTPASPSSPAPAAVRSTPTPAAKALTINSPRLTPAPSLVAPSRKTACATCPRDDHGRIARSEAAKHQFETQSGYPHGRSGYVVDHIRPLACGGLDAPSNMQWQTVAVAKAKDKTERKGC